MAEGRKQIAFDLDTGALKNYYPKGSYENAYYDIRGFMNKNDFIWQQGSVYVSNKPVSASKAAKLLTKLASEQPWLNICMRDCVVTNIGRTHNLKHIFDKNFYIKSK